MVVSRSVLLCGRDGRALTDLVLVDRLPLERQLLLQPLYIVLQQGGQRLRAGGAPGVRRAPLGYIHVLDPLEVLGLLSYLILSYIRERVPPRRAARCEPDRPVWRAGSARGGAGGGGCGARSLFGREPRRAQLYREARDGPAPRARGGGGTAPGRTQRTRRLAASPRGRAGRSAGVRRRARADAAPTAVPTAAA